MEENKNDLMCRWSLQRKKQRLDFIMLISNFIDMAISDMLSMWQCLQPQIVGVELTEKTSKKFQNPAQRL